MKNLFEAAAIDEVKTRLNGLRPESQRQWGTMGVAQMVAHCSGGLQMAVGDIAPPRVLIGRILGGTIKKLAIRNENPLRKSSPTVKELIIKEERDLEKERVILSGLIERFAKGGPAACSKQPHSFFGPMNPDEWAILMYKHLDHHFRQFGG